MQLRRPPPSACALVVCLVKGEMPEQFRSCSGDERRASRGIRAITIEVPDCRSSTQAPKGLGSALWRTWSIMWGEMDDPGPVRRYGNEAARAVTLGAGWARPWRRGRVLSRSELEAVASVLRAAGGGPLNRRGLWGEEWG
jgi:hypothetical protein